MVAYAIPPELPNTLREAIEQYGEGPFALGLGNIYANRYDEETGLLKPGSGGLGLTALTEALNQAEAEYAIRRAELVRRAELEPQSKGVMSLPLTINQRYNNYLNQTNNITFEELVKLYKRNLGTA